MVPSIGIVALICKHQKGGKQEGDEPHCPDHQNTNVGEEEKERALEKKAGAAWLLTVVVGTNAVRLAVHGKKGQERECCSGG
jgi:hypothetical protein